MATAEKRLSSVEDAVELLRRWREENVRRSDDVVDIWETLLDGSMATEALGDEHWMVLEQVAVAAMDAHRPDVADRCLHSLREQFQLESIRVRRLYAMRYELEEEWEQALQIYDQILEEDDANSSARKRKVAILRAQGDNARAIENLTKYLKDFMSDSEAWMELCDLYILEQDYAKAGFCCEELILHNPSNHLYFQRYAEIRYSQGGFENLELAKSYYSKAVALHPGNMRALYGLLLTSSNLATSPKTPSQKKREHLKTVLWASQQVTKQFEEKTCAPMPHDLLEAIIGQIQVQGP